MPDYAPNFTARYRVHYRTVGKGHTVQFRLARGTTDTTDIVIKVGNFLAAIQSHLYTDWQIISADFAPEDTDFFVPDSLPANPTGAVSLTGRTSLAGVSSISFPGKSAGGSRAILYIYGSNYFPDLTAPSDTDGRILPSEASWLTTAVGVLNDDSPILVGNDNQPVSWYLYANEKINDHWLGKARRG